LPANTLDVQEATVFLTDKITTPGTDSFLMVTTNGATDADHISVAGPTYTNEKTYSSLTAFGTLIEGWVDWNGIGLGEYNAATVPLSGSNSGSALTIVCPVSQSTQADRATPLFGAYLDGAGIAMTDGKVYRMKAQLSSSNSDPKLNPTIQMGLNGRATGPGFGYIEYPRYVNGTGVGPTNVAASYSAFLWANGTGSAMPWFQVNDDAVDRGGTITMGLPVSIDSFDPNMLSGGTVLFDKGTGAPVGFGSEYTAFIGPLRLQLSKDGSTITEGPPAQGTAGTWTTTLTSTRLTVGLSSPLAASAAGLVALYNGNMYTASADKLVVVKVTAKTSAATSANLPSLYIFTPQNGANFQAVQWKDRRGTTSVGGPTATASGFYAMFETGAASAQYGLALYFVADTTGQSGDIQVERITVTEYPKVQ
jgi:hypothetical protein